jgi:SnoaL-like domain
MTLDLESVNAWLGGYVQAWETYDRQAITALFSRDATYRYHPFDEPIRGQQAIVESWLEDARRDSPGTYSAEYKAIAINGDLAVARGRSRYYTDSARTKLLRQFDNIFILRFDEQGRCQSFEEWYMSPRGQT